MKFLNAESVASMFDIDVKEVIALIERRDLRAVRIGDTYRIAESAVADFIERQSASQLKPEDKDVWYCPTLEQDKMLRVRGKDRHFVVWDTKGLNRREFTRDFVTATLEHFRGKEVRSGLSFSARKEPGTLGAWFDEHFPKGSSGTFMLASILVYLGYATRERRGYIRFKNSYPDDVAVPENAKPSDDCRQAIRELQEYRKRLSLGGLKIRDLIEEGRM